MNLKGTLLTFLVVISLGWTNKTEVSSDERYLFMHHPFATLDNTRMIHFSCEYNGNAGDYGFEYCQFSFDRDGHTVYISSHIPITNSYAASTLRFHRKGVIGKGKVYRWRFRYHSRDGFTPWMYGGYFQVNSGEIVE